MEPGSCMVERIAYAFPFSASSWKIGPWRENFSSTTSVPPPFTRTVSYSMRSGSQLPS